MRKILTVFIFAVCCLSFCLSLRAENISFAEDTNQTFVVTANSASLFELPDFSSSKLKQISHNEEISILIEGGFPKVFENGGYIFFKVVNFEFDGFVFADLVTPKNEIITGIPNFNAQTNSNCKVFFLEDNLTVESEISLNRGTRIFLYKGFKSKEQFTAIAFVFENQVLYGFLETKNIAPDGVNPLIISCIFLILAALGIIFAWLFMKNRKIKINKKRAKTKKMA